MKLAIIYNPQDSKLLPSAYSWTYRDMFLAVLERFAPVQMVTESCEASAIESDAILFWDVHSSHHIEIAGIENHRAVKFEYFNDPHQIEQRGVYRASGQSFHKLSAVQRCERAKRRAVQWIICPYQGGYERYIAPHSGDMQLLWFPVAPALRRISSSPLAARCPEVLANGHTWIGENDFQPYEFRRWAFERPGVTFVEHSIVNHGTKGAFYQAFISQYAAALALCDNYVVPKYLEIPMSGCLCFCQMLPDYGQMGFVDGVNCISVDRNNFDERIQDFLSSPAAYQSVATAGRELATAKYTAWHFADFLWKHIKSCLSEVNQ